MSTEEQDTKDAQSLLKITGMSVPMMAWAVARQLESSYEAMKIHPQKEPLSIRHILAVAWNAGVEHQKKSSRNTPDHEFREIARNLDVMADRLRDIARKDT